MVAALVAAEHVVVLVILYAAVVQMSVPLVVELIALQCQSR